MTLGIARGIGGPADEALAQAPPPAPSVGAAPLTEVPEVPRVVPTHDQGALAGLVVYLSPGHGYVAHETGTGWQRPVVHGLLEDTYTARFAADELIPALERAGAVVLTPRERDPHTTIALADDASAGFVAEGVVGTEMAGRWYRAQPTPALSEAVASSTLLSPGGRAAWTLTAPEAGDWQVYGTWVAGEGRDRSARYTILHPGGAEAHVVDQTARGDTWFPLARVALAAGDTVTVVLEGSGNGEVSANAVKMGGGIIPVADRRTGQRVNLPAWQVASVHYLPTAGAPEEVWGTPGGGFAGDAAARARWADWTSPDGEEAVYLSLHTDAGGGRGTTAFVRRKCGAVGRCPEVADRSHALADTLRGTYVATAKRFDRRWVDRGTRAEGLAEVSHHLNPEIPSVLLELGFHDHAADARVLGDREFARAAADSLVAGMIRWRAGANEELPPAPAAKPAWEGDALAWAPGAANAVHGEARRWRVRSRIAQGAAWSVPAWTVLPRVDLGGAVTEVEVVGENAAGLGRPLLLTAPAALAGGR